MIALPVSVPSGVWFINAVKMSIVFFVKYFPENT